MVGRLLRAASSRGRLGLLLGVLLLGCVQGCAINRDSASIAPDRDLSSLKRLLVVTSADDERGTDRAIADVLAKLGFDAAIGKDGAVPGDVDAVVTYRAQWDWDITPYLKELTIFVREPRDNALLARGNSYHTSLTRKSADEMAQEVLARIFRPAKSR
jgi:hypothetical protein